MPRGEVMTKEVVERFKNAPLTQERETLNTWHMIAVIKRWLGQSTEDVAKLVGKAPGTIDNLMCSPAAKRLKAHLDKKLNDPVALAKELAIVQSLDVATDWYLALDWAKEARDYAAVAKMTKDLAALGGVQATPPKQQIETSKTIRIVLDSESIDQEAVEADWEELEDDDDESDF